MLDTLINIHTHTIPKGLIAVYQNPASAGAPEQGFFSAGIHPQDAHDFNRQVAQLEQLLPHERCIAVGECGLDARLEINMEEQEAAYIAQLKLAARLNKPIILHCVNAWERCRFLHASHAPNQAIIYHGFSKPSILQQVLDYPAAMISIGHRLLTDKPLQECVPGIPIDRIFLETDDADVNLSELYDQLAELKSLPLAALIDQIYSNFKRIFDHVQLA